MARQPKVAERRHHDRIRDMACLGCGGSPVSVHHITSRGYERMTKDHRYVVPLCPECHQYAPTAIHRIGHRAFCGLVGIDLYQRAVDLWDAQS